MASRIKIAVLCGGPSSEWEVSKRSGAEVVKHLPKEKYDAKLVQITQDGRWMLLDRKKAIPLKIFGADGRLQKSDLKKFDIAFIALHGKFGEDGKVQSILETIGLPYTGSGILASALGMDKRKAQDVVSSSVPVAKTISLFHSSLQDPIKTEQRLRKELRYPFVIKPNESGSSFGVSIVNGPEDLMPALETAFVESTSVLAQEYIKGRELTCGVLGNSSEECISLPPVEIISHSKFFDYEAKYSSNSTEEICPARLPKRIEKEIQRLSLLAHTILGCRGLTRSDFILKDDKLYFLEINTSPGLTEASLCPKEAKALGWTMSELLDKIVSLAIQK